MLPNYLMNIPVNENQNIHGHNTRNAGNLYYNRTEHVFADKCIRNQLKNLLNNTNQNLPRHIKENYKYNDSKNRYIPKEIQEKFQTHSLKGIAKYAKKFFIEHYKYSGCGQMEPFGQRQRIAIHAASRSRCCHDDKCNVVRATIVTSQARALGRKIPGNEQVTSL